MKAKSTLRILLLGCSSLLAVSSSSATTYHWDNTSPIEDAGFGTAGGTWGTDAFWSESSAGTDVTGIAGPLITDDLNFGAVGTVLAAGTVTVTGTQSANSITFGVGSGAIVLSGGTIDLANPANINVNNTAGDIISSNLTGAGNVIKSGTGVLTLTGTNTFVGSLAIATGTVRVNSSSAAGNNGTIIGNGTAANTTFASADATALTFTKTVSTNAGGGGINFGDATGTGDLTFTGNLTRAGGSTNRTVNVTGSNTTVTFNGNLLSPGTPTAATTFFKGGSGTLSIKGTGSGSDLGFSNVVVTSGTLAVTRLANLGVASSLSKAENATPGAVSITLDTGGKLSYIDGGAAASTTDRLLQIGRTANGAAGTIRNDATNASETVTFSNTNAIAYGNVDQTRTLILGGTNTGMNTLASAIGDNGTAVVSLTKQDAGTWMLTGNNTYTGTTSINAGVLVHGGADAIPGGIASGGSGTQISINNGVIGLGAGDFTRAVTNTIGTAGTVRFASNGGFAAYGADRIVNFGGAAGLTNWSSGLNGKQLVLGAADSTNMVTVVNPMTVTTVTRPVQVNDGLAAVDGQLSGAISQTAGAFGGLNKTGTGTLALTGASTFTGSVVVSDGAVIVNSVTNTGSPSSIGQGTSGFTLAGGTFRYAQINGSGGGAAAINRTFAIAKSSSLDASGTGALVLNNTAIISPDDAGQTGSWAASGSATVTGLTSTANLAIGMQVSGVGIPAGATITQILSSTSINVSANTTVLGSAASITFGYPSARTLTLTGTNTDTNTIAGILQDSSSLGAGVLSITKSGIGNWTLSGTNTYTGATTVSEGNLALVGGSQTSAITVSSGASLGFTLGSPTNSTSSVDLTNGTVKITGAVDNSSDYPLMTAALGFTGAPALDSPITDYALQLQNSGTELWLVYTGGGGDYAAWALANSIAGGVNGDSDNDGVKNLVEYALQDGGERGVRSGDTITFNKRGAPYGGDVTYTIEISIDLGIADIWDTAVSGVTEDSGKIQYTFTPGTPVKNFARLKVTQP